jgi:predicted aspartyl protease
VLGVEGLLDDLDEAFLTLDFGQGPLDFQIDTGFSGTLVVGEELFDPSQAKRAGTIEARLAADQTWIYERFDVEFDWLGKRTEVRILVGPGKECLLGTQLLVPHRLDIDYGQRSVRLVPNPKWRNAERGSPAG